MTDADVLAAHEKHVHAKLDRLLALKDYCFRWSASPTAGAVLVVLEETRCRKRFQCTRPTTLEALAHVVGAAMEFVEVPEVA